MKGNTVKAKSYAFAIRVVNLCKWLSANKNEHVLSKQLLRCGTSIGANVEEACGSYSEKEFAAKIQIAFKEALETRYWLRLMHDTGFVETAGFESVSTDCEELVRILSAITKTLREKSGSIREAADLDPEALYFTSTS